MKEIDPVRKLQALVDGHPTQRAAAKSLEISGAYLSDLLNGRRDFSPAILERLGLRRAITEADNDRQVRPAALENRSGRR